MKSPRGFTLIEIVIVLVIVGLLLTMGVNMFGTLMVQQRRYVTTQRMTALDGALAVFVSQQQRLPCPADGALASGQPAAGLEQRDPATGDCLNAQARGVVPWRSIGLSEQDVTDGFFGRLTYRVALGLARNAALALNGCDPAGTKAADGAAPYLTCSPGCDSTMANCTNSGAIVANRGLAIRNGSGAVVADPAAGFGAAYVVISHGENRASAYSSEGVAQEAVGAQQGTSEAVNSAANALAAFYVEDVVTGTDTPSHFDDLMTRPTILGLATRANLAPRAH